MILFVFVETERERESKNGNREYTGSVGNLVCFFLFCKSEDFGLVMLINFVV